MNRIAIFSLVGVLVGASAGKAQEFLKPKALRADMRQVARSNDAFTFDLFAQVCEREGNLIFSPGSISTALAMTYAGARNKTADEMAKVMHLTLNQERVHFAVGRFMKEFNGVGIDSAKRPYQLSVSNTLWGKIGFEWKSDFLKVMKDNYNAGLIPIDFSTGDEARKIINERIEKETREKIRNLIPSGIINPNTRLLLTNAIYFRADWDVKFDKKATEQLPFFLANSKQIKVPMMKQKGDYDHYTNQNFQALVLPYKGREISMLLIVPERRDGIADLQKELSPKMLNSLIDGLTRRKDLTVIVPKFKMEFDLPLKKTLQDMGMKTLFDDKLADLSGMTSREELCVTDVFHKAFIEVNEEGSEASAATGLVVETRGVSPVFQADRPFVFLLWDNRTRSILFIGRVSDPTK